MLPFKLSSSRVTAYSFLGLRVIAIQLYSSERFGGYNEATTPNRLITIERVLGAL